jgi:GNAT superfamily N-acetyltransferase
MASHAGGMREEFVRKLLCGRSAPALNPRRVKPPLSIRRATEADTGSVAALCAELGYPVDAGVVGERVGAVLASPADLLLVAVDGGNVIGWLQAHAATVIETGFRVEITGLVVSGNARRLGAGRALVAAAENWAQGLGAIAVVVRTDVRREGSHAFYPAVGYGLKKTQGVYWKSLRPPG